MGGETGGAATLFYWQWKANMCSETLHLLCPRPLIPHLTLINPMTFHLFFPWQVLVLPMMNPSFLLG